MSNSELACRSELERLVAEAADDFTERLNRGERPDVEEYVARHPEAGPALREALAAVLLLRLSGAGGGGDSPAPLTGALGDYRILREVGRGGMGVVYEAVQVSLDRRVALKVLPFAATMDPRHLQRFHNEARAAASLHHEHIVPVHGVGCERGVHYYAMQFIDGRRLSDLIARQALPGSHDLTAPYAAAAPGADTAPRAADATAPAPRDAAFFRRAAGWGAQAADALEHAHALGVVHRDVKPDNLLIDGQGKLWVADFGLARTGADTGLTMSGDVLGTLRYMSPEQALARHGLVDHRTDVYALGATLYELITGRPAVEGRDRAELLCNIALAEPRAPRAHNRAVPAELETVVLKCLAKEPAERYASAKDLADDLRRYLDDRPVQARRPGLARRLGKLARRHRAVAATAAAGLLLAVAALAASAGWVANDRAVRRALAEERVREAVEVAEARLAEGDPHAPDLVAAARRLEAQLDGGLVRGELRGRAERALADQAMLAELEQARLAGASVRDGAFDSQAILVGYARAFRAYGIDLEGETLSVEEAAGLIRGRTIAAHLVAAMDDWAIPGRKGDPLPPRAYLLEVVGQADPDPWRGQLRKALQSRDRAQLKRLAREDSAARLPAGSLALLGNVLVREGLSREAVEVLGPAQQRYPADFWVNHHLADALVNAQPPRQEEAVGFYRAAVALRPGSPGVRLNLAHVLERQGRHGDVAGYLREAVRLKPDYAEAHYNLGLVLTRQGKEAEAADSFNEAIRHKPAYADAHYDLGVVLGRLGRPDEAVASYRRVIRLNTGHFAAHNNLGLALMKLGRVDEAITCFRDAIYLQPGRSEPHYNLGEAMTKQGKVNESVACFRESILRYPGYAAAHLNLGSSLGRLGRTDEAVACCREAVRLKPDLAPAYTNLGYGLLCQGKAAEAADCYREAVRLQPGNAVAVCNLGNILVRLGRLDEAIVCFRQHVRLQPEFVTAHTNLGDALWNKGQVAEAGDCYRQAVHLRPDLPSAHIDLGNTLAGQGKQGEAIACFREAVRLRPNVAEPHYRLGQSLMLQGRLAEALSSLRRAHQFGVRQPGLRRRAGKSIRECHHLIMLEGALPAVLSGQRRPAGAAEAAALATLCRIQKRWAAAAGLYRQAFAADPSLAADSWFGRRFDAARAAVRAGTEEGVGDPALDEEARSLWRGQALTWLRAELSSVARHWRTNAGAAVLVRINLGHWRIDPDLAGVRGAALARLPEAERQAWSRLWAEVDRLERAVDPPRRSPERGASPRR